MVSFKGSITDGPRVSTSDPGGSAKRAVRWTVGVGIMLFLFGLASGMVVPLLNKWASRLSGGRVNSGDGITVSY